MELKKETIAINETVLRDNSQILVQSDIIVPDIKSDMAKILQIDSEAVVDEAITSEGKVDIAGKVNLKILYVPDGDAKPVCAISTSVPFTADIENSAITMDGKCMVSADACHIEFEMLNSRKLSVKVIVELDTRCIRQKEVELVCGVDDEEAGSIELKKDELNLHALIGAQHAKFDVKETLDFPAGKPAALDILKIDAKITDKEIRLVTGKVVVKGTINLCTLYVSSDNSLEFMEHDIPFTEVLDMDGATENCKCDMDLKLCQTEFALRPDLDGDMRLIDVSLLFDANVSLSQDTNLYVISDCFCTDKNIICESQPFPLEILAGEGKAQQTVRDTISLSPNAPELVSIYNLIVKPYISQIQVSDGMAEISGMLDCYILYLSSSPSMPVHTLKSQIPFQTSLEIKGLTDKMDCDVNAEVAHASYNLTMTGEIEVRAAINLWAKAIRKDTASLITNIYVDTDTPVVSRHGIILYFVQPGDTLWQIAKRYHASIPLLKQLNKLEDENRIVVGQRLLIPNVAQHKK